MAALGTQVNTKRKVEEGTIELGVNSKGKKILKTNKPNITKGEISKEDEEKRRARQGRFQDDFSKKAEIRQESKFTKFNDFGTYF
jgi:hypothetical protein